jgi:hypothetical protein
VTRIRGNLNKRTASREGAKNLIELKDPSDFCERLQKRGLSSECRIKK